MVLPLCWMSLGNFRPSCQSMISIKHPKHLVFEDFEFLNLVALSLKLFVNLFPQWVPLVHKIIHCSNFPLLVFHCQIELTMTGHISSSVKLLLKHLHIVLLYIPDHLHCHESAQRDSWWLHLNTVVVSPKTNNVIVEERFPRTLVAYSLNFLCVHCREDQMLWLQLLPKLISQRGRGV